MTVKAVPCAQPPVHRSSQEIRGYTTRRNRVSAVENSVSFSMVRCKSAIYGGVSAPVSLFHLTTSWVVRPRTTLQSLRLTPMGRPQGSPLQSAFPLRNYLKNTRQHRNSLYCLVLFICRKVHRLPDRQITTEVTHNPPFPLSAFRFPSIRPALK
jgi:hypothetical protein